MRLDFFSTHASKEKSKGQNETPLNSRVFRPLLRLQLPLRRCRRSKERSFCRLEERRGELKRGKAPRARAEARAGSKVSSGSGSGMRDPRLVFASRFSKARQTNQPNVAVARILTHLGARSMPGGASRAGDEFFPRRISSCFFVFFFLERLIAVGKRDESAAAAAAAALCRRLPSRAARRRERERERSALCSTKERAKVRLVSLRMLLARFSERERLKRE